MKGENKRYAQYFYLYEIVSVKGCKRLSDDSYILWKFYKRILYCSGFTRPHARTEQFVHWKNRQFSSLILFVSKLQSGRASIGLKHPIYQARSKDRFGGPLIFAETGRLTACGCPGAAAFLLKKCLRPPPPPPLEHSWSRGGGGL